MFDPKAKSLIAEVRQAQRRESEQQERDRILRLYGQLPPLPRYEQDALL